MPLYEADCYIGIWWTPFLLAWVTFQWVSLGRTVQPGNTAASDWNGSTYTMWYIFFYLHLQMVLVILCMKLIRRKITMKCLLWVSGWCELWEWLEITGSSNHWGPRKIRQNERNKRWCTVLERAFWLWSFKTMCVKMSCTSGIKV